MHIILFKSPNSDSADISINLLDTHPPLKLFLEKLANRKFVSGKFVGQIAIRAVFMMLSCYCIGRSMQSKYMKKTYDNALATVRDRIGDDPIYLETDETCDASDRHIGNVYAGSAQNPEIGPYLIHTNVMPSADGDSTIALLNDAMAKLYPESIKVFRPR